MRDWDEFVWHIDYEGISPYVLKAADALADRLSAQIDLLTANHNILCSAAEDKANRIMLSESAMKTKGLGG